MSDNMTKASLYAGQYDARTGPRNARARAAKRKATIGQRQRSGAARERSAAQLAIARAIEHRVPRPITLPKLKFMETED